MAQLNDRPLVVARIPRRLKDQLEGLPRGAISAAIRVALEQLVRRHAARAGKGQAA